MSNRTTSVLFGIAVALSIFEARAQAHPTTSTCSENWQSTFAITNTTLNYRDSFMGWSKLNTSGAVVSCGAGTGMAPGCINCRTPNRIDFPWPGYSTPCWFWRHRCGEHYIRMDDDAGEGHVWFEEWGQPTNDNIPRMCDPRDGKVPGFVGKFSSFFTPNCQNWKQGNLLFVTNHAAGYALILWSEHTSNHAPVIFDLSTIQVLRGPAIEVSIKVGSGASDWFVAELPPNATGAGPNGVEVWDVSSWGFEVERAEFRTAQGGGMPFHLGDITYKTPSTSGWPLTTVTLVPTADAYVRGGTFANTNFGAATTLQTKTNATASENRMSYLSFDISSVKMTVTSAKLRLFGNSATSAKVHNLTPADPLWDETSITFNNRPVDGGDVNTATIGTAAAWYEWDVTNVIQNRKTTFGTDVSFKVSSNVTSSNNPTSFNSKEGANKPQLVVVSQ